MARYSTGGRSSAGSTTLPIFSLYNTASISGYIVEIGVFNTTTTAVALKLTRMTTAGTQGTGLTESGHDPASAAAALTGVNTHSVAPTLGADLGYNIVLGAAIGSGVLWTFGARGLYTGAVGTGNGVGCIVATGTGQVCDFWMVWEE